MVRSSLSALYYVHAIHLCSDVLQYCLQRTTRPSKRTSFFWWSYVMGQHSHGRARLVTSAWDAGVYTLLGGEGAPGKMLHARARLRGAVWDWRWAGGLGGSTCSAPGGAPASYPLKTQGACTTHDRGRRYLWSISPRCGTPSSSMPFSHIGTRWSVSSLFAFFRSACCTTVASLPLSSGGCWGCLRWLFFVRNVVPRSGGRIP